MKKNKIILEQPDNSGKWKPVPPGQTVDETKFSSKESPSS